MVPLFRQGDRQTFGPGFFYTSGGSKYQQAKVVRLTSPPLVLGTFKLWPSSFTDAVSALQVLTNTLSLTSL